MPKQDAFKPIAERVKAARAELEAYFAEPKTAFSLTGESSVQTPSGRDAMNVRACSAHGIPLPWDLAERAAQALEGHPPKKSAGNKTINAVRDSVICYAIIVCIDRHKLSLNPNSMEHSACDVVADLRSMEPDSILQIYKRHGAETRKRIAFLASGHRLA